MKNNYVEVATETIKLLRQKRKDLIKAKNNKETVKELSRVLRFLEMNRELRKRRNNKMELNCFYFDGKIIFDVISVEQIDEEEIFMIETYICDKSMNNINVIKREVENTNNVKTYKLI